VTPTMIGRMLWVGALVTLGLPVAPAGLSAAQFAHGAVQAAAGLCPDGVLAAHDLDPSRIALNGIAAVSPSDVWAVGSVWPSDARHSLGLIEHYNGKVWCAVDTHDWNDDGNSLPGVPGLYGVYALSARDVWTVGTRFEHWDGHVWRVVAAPPLVLDGAIPVSATSSANVWVLGGGMVERWDGRHWQAVPSPTAGPASVGLRYANAIATVSVTDTWLAGDLSPFGRGLWVMHWDGRQWGQATLLPRSPVPATYGGGLLYTCGTQTPYTFGKPSLVAFGHDDVWVLASQSGEAPGGVCPLAWHWDGRRWREVWMITGADLNLLEQTSGGSAAYAWGLGSVAGTPNGGIWALTDPEQFSLHYDGHNWHVISAFSGPKMTVSFDLTGISAPSDSDVWATANDTLSPWNAFHWDGKTWRGVAAIPAG